jgi:DNA-binding HxlR family transcriptional regulator
MGQPTADSPPYPADPAVTWKECPIGTSLRFLGRKWTLTILRDVAFFPQVSFATIRRRNPGITQRALSLRLRELAGEDLVRRVVPADNPRHPYYELTAKGLEVWPILSALFQYGTHHHADVVFEDQRARDLAEVYPHDADLLMGPLVEYARTAAPSSSAGLAAATPGRPRRAPGRRP